MIQDVSGLETSFGTGSKVHAGGFRDQNWDLGFQSVFKDISRVSDLGPRVFI